MVAVTSTMHPLGWKLPDFTLPEPLSGNLVAPRDYAEKQALLVVFMCNHCPYVVHLRDALIRLSLDYLPRGLGVMAINSNDVDAYPADAPERMIEDARKYRFPFRYLFDDMQLVAKVFKAACTPDFFLFNAERELVYRGQFDDSRPSHRTAPDGPHKGAQPTGKDVREAIELVLGGKPVPAEGQKPSLGCNIKWRQGNEPDWFLPYTYG